MSVVLAAAIPAAAVVIAALLGRRKLEEIHVLVNSRLSEALDEIKALKAQLPDEDEES